MRLHGSVLRMEGNMTRWWRRSLWLLTRSKLKPRWSKRQATRDKIFFIYKRGFCRGKTRSRKKVMLSDSRHSNSEIYTPTSALNVSRGRISTTAKGESQKEKQWCDHYNRPYHTRETCWKIHRKPANWKPRNQRKGGQSVGWSTYMVEAEKGNLTNFTLTVDQLEALQ